MATLRDVAVLAGVSVKTVSNVVNGYAFVKPENRRRVENALIATGYRPNLHDMVGSLGVLDEDGQPLAVGAQTHPEAARLYFAGYTNPLTGVLRQAGIEARAIAHAFRREKARAPLLTSQVGDRTADTH